MEHGCSARRDNLTSAQTPLEIEYMQKKAIEEEFLFVVDIVVVIIHLPSVINHRPIEYFDMTMRMRAITCHLNFIEVRKMNKSEESREREKNMDSNSSEEWIIINEFRMEIGA